MDKEIINCHTIAELNSLQRMHTLTDQEQRLVFEKQMEIFQRIREWRLENEQLGLAPDLTDTWTPEQRERFLCEYGIMMNLYYRLTVGKRDRMMR